MGLEDKSALAFSDILYMVDKHNRQCTNHNCPCHRREIVQYILNKGHTYDLKKLILDEEEIELLNSAGQNVFIKSNKNAQSMKMLTQFQHFNFYAASSAAEVSDTPLMKVVKAGEKGKVGTEDYTKQRVRMNIQ